MFCLSSFCDFPLIYDLSGGTDGPVACTSSMKARDSAEAKTAREPTEMAEEPVVASRCEPSEPRLEDLLFEEPKPTLPRMDPPVFHVEDYLQDFFCVESY